MEKTNKTLLARRAAPPSMAIVGGALRKVRFHLVATPEGHHSAQRDA